MLETLMVPTMFFVGFVGNVGQRRATTMCEDIEMTIRGAEIGRGRHALL
jgi:hypothetical protein